MIRSKLKKYNVILGSTSPRRQELLSTLGINFKIQKSVIQEEYPGNLKGLEISEFLAKKKSNAITQNLYGNYLLITADTIVISNKKILHKPKTLKDAINTLNLLSGKKHEVITSCCIKSRQKEYVFSSITKVNFKKLSKEEIEYYIREYKPFDKAGSYAIQEWIGHIGIKSIDGSYNNVVGLPTAKLYEKLGLFF